MYRLLDVGSDPGTNLKETKMIEKTQTETPWTDLLPLLLTAIENPLLEEKDIRAYRKAVDELHRMAKMADIGAQAVAWQDRATQTGAVMKWGNGHTVIR